MSALTVFITVFTLIIIAVPGFILGKLKMLPEKATKALSTVLLFVCQSALTFMSFQKTEYSGDVLIRMLIVFGFALLAHAVMIVIVMLAIPNKRQDAGVRVAKYASVFGNVGYMGLPFLQSLFPGEGEIIIYGAVIIAAFNFLSWTIGIYMITGDKKFISLKKAIINPPVIAMLISLPLFIILQKPIAEIGEGNLNLFLSKLIGSVNLLGEMVTPLAMIILGLRLAEMDLKSIFADKWVYITAALKLMICPIIATLIVLPFGDVISENIKYAIFFAMAMPSATTTLLFSEQYGGQPHSASAMVLFSTVASIGTIPLMYLLFTLIV